MKAPVVLVATSLLCILLTTFHHSADVVYGLAPGGRSNLPVALAMAAWLFATLVLPARRSGLVVILLMSLLAALLPVIHVSGRVGLTAGITSRSFAFFFVWTLVAIGVVSPSTIVLSIRGLWRLRQPGRPAPPEPADPATAVVTG